jgi:hypothetical protein
MLDESQCNDEDGIGQDIKSGSIDVAIKYAGCNSIHFER